MATQPVPRMTLEEWLEHEATAEIKSEYHGGEVLAMTGATVEHASLCARIGALLGPALRGRGKLVDSSLGLYIPAFDLAVYPDIQVLGEPVQCKNNDRRLVLNPTVVFEVLSPSTRNYDQGDKAAFYRSVASIAEYVTVDSKRREVHHQVRRGENEWAFLRHAGDGEQLRLESLSLGVALNDLYEGILEH